MKKINMLYWIFTGLLIPVFGIGSVIGLIGSPQADAMMAQLGFPPYLATFLNLAKLLALVVIFVPGFVRLREWAYAGLAIDVCGAMYSLLMVFHSPMYIIFPIIALSIVLTSYFLWHKRMSLKSTV